MRTQNMQYLRVFHPHRVKEFLQINEPFLQRKFAEKAFPDQKKGGRPRIGVRWVLVALCILGRREGISWRELGDQFCLCEFLTKEGWLSRIPSKSTFHAMWDSLPKEALERWITQLVTGIALQNHDKSLMVDSTGVKMILGSFWRRLKWNPREMSKTSPFFRKLHIFISTPSRAIVSIRSSLSKSHDTTRFGQLWKQLGKQLLKRIKRFYLDKAYWDESILGLIDQNDIQPVIEPKKNSVDHGLTKLWID